MQEDLMCELLELLELFCEVLLARFGLLETIKLVLFPLSTLEVPDLSSRRCVDREIDPGVSEAVASIIHAAPR